MSAFAILNTPPKALGNLASFNFSLVTCNLNEKDLSDISASVNSLNRSLGKVFGSGTPGTKAVQVNLVKAVTADIPAKLKAVSADAGGIGGMVLNATAYQQVLNTGVLRFNRILCSRSAVLTDNTLLQNGGKTLKVVDYDLLAGNLPHNMLSHIAVMNDPLNFVPQIFPGNPIPCPWMPCVDTSKKEAFFEFLEVAEAAYSASGGGPAGILAGAVALVKAGYNMYKNHMDDDDEFQDYFTQDLKNFAFKHMPSFGGASHKPWDRDFGAADKFKGLIQDLLTTRLIDINDLIDMKFINPVDLFNDKIRTNIENYLGVPGIIVRAEIATIKK